MKFDIRLDDLSYRDSILLDSVSMFVVNRMAEGIEVIGVNKPLHIFFVRAEFRHQSITGFRVRRARGGTFSTFFTL